MPSWVMDIMFYVNIILLVPVTVVCLSHCCSLVCIVALLEEKKLLDLPKLLDICAVFGHENEDLTRSLVRFY